MVRRNTTQQERYRQRWAATGSACAICGKPIDYTLAWPDKWCFVVDHKTAIANGGRHDFANTQPAHNHCNSQKRARAYAPIVKRSGALN